jgi:NAD(P)-dependent dehydrogenase (short-subunit alcohol dehydrogenase family)
MLPLRDKVAFISGGAMGNGESIAMVMAEKGATVILADISETVFNTARLIGAQAYACQLDITDYPSVERAALACIERYGHIDILVNNAGIARFVDVKQMDTEILERHWRVNVEGAWNCAKALVGQMMRRGYGRLSTCLPSPGQGCPTPA